MQSGEFQFHPAPGEARAVLQRLGELAAGVDRCRGRNTYADPNPWALADALRTYDAGVWVTHPPVRAGEEATVARVVFWREGEAVRALVGVRREEFVTHPCEGGRDGLALDEHLLLGAGFAEVTAVIGRLIGTRALHPFVALRRDGAAYGYVQRRWYAPLGAAWVSQGWQRHLERPALEALCRAAAAARRDLFVGRGSLAEGASCPGRRGLLTVDGAPGPEVVYRGRVRPWEEVLELLRLAPLIEL
jgi:hypothetical protein